jgi:hypothetical protein
MAGGLTTDEVIKRARGHFGEETPLTVQDTVLREWINDAIKDLYDQLPPTELRGFIANDTLSVGSGGSADLLDTWDRVLEIRDSAGVPLHLVSPEVVRSIDLGTFFMPAQTVYALTRKTVLVRPSSVSTIYIDHQEPPPLITATQTGDNIETLTGLHARWHNALVMRMTQYMYGQEEDWSSAQAFQQTWNSLIQSAWDQSGYRTPAEARAGVPRHDGMVAQAGSE